MMYKKGFPYLILCALLISPLIHVSIEDSFQSRTMWSGLLAISLILIGFFIRYPFRVQEKFLGLYTMAGVGVLSSLFLGRYSIHPFAFYISLLSILLFLAWDQTRRMYRENMVLLVALILGMFSLYAQWGIAQFIVQQDLGLYRIGESVLNQNLSGVASFYTSFQKLIRAYGPFGHSNSLGGVLLLGLILLYTYRKSFSGSLFFIGTFFTISLGLIFSFSRNALVGLIAIALLFLWERKRRVLIPIILAGLLFTPLSIGRSTDIHDVAAEDRLMGVKWFQGVMTPETLITGTGIGNYTKTLKEYLRTNSIEHDPWDIAPIHSVPLFILGEIGILLFIPLAFFLIAFFIQRKAWIPIVLLPCILFDHYFATQFSPLLFLIITMSLVVQ